MKDAGKPFFIGWALPPRDLVPFLAVVAVAALVVFPAVAYVVAATAADPGDGTFRWDLGRISATGVLTGAPYPVLTVTESDHFEPGHTLLLSGPGKVGVADRAAPLDGTVVTATGFALKRGDLDMLQVDFGDEALAAADGAADAAAPTPRPLGRWRITGEICDGKCYAGAMRPGEGLAHKACANLCVIGGVPPILVATAPVDGERFLLLGDESGGPIDRRLLDHTAILVDLEGTVERRGSLLVFLADPDSVRRAR